MMVEKLEKTMDKGDATSAQHYKDLIRNQKKYMDFNKQMMYSATILHFYNTNQIEKMKIRRGQLVISEMSTVNPERFIEQVI